MMSTSFISQGGNQGQERSVTWPRPPTGLATSQDKNASLSFPLIRSTCYSHAAFHMPAFCDDSGRGDRAMSFSGSPRVIWGPRARAPLEALLSHPVQHSFPTTELPTSPIVPKALEGMKINKACQLCSRVVTCSPPCHFQLQSRLSGLHVIGVSRALSRGRGAWGSEPGTPGRAGAAQPL